MLHFGKIARISKDKWRAINLLTNKHSLANTSTTSGISPDDLNNHFCSISSKVIKTDNSLSNELTALEQISQKPVRSLLWQSGKWINLYVI